MSRGCLLNIIPKSQLKLTKLAKLEPQTTGKAMPLLPVKSAALRDYSYAIAKGMLSYIA